MTPHFFAVPANDPAEAQRALQAFCAQHRVASIDRQLVQAGLDSFWAVCVTVVGEGPAAARSASKNPARERPRVDHKDVLSPEDFAVFARLRVLRKELAEAAGLPPYVVFTNAQLAEMVTCRVRTRAELRSLSGVGAARVARYGDARAFGGRGRRRRRVVPPRSPIGLREVASIDTLTWAYWRASRGKQDQPEVAALARELDGALHELGRRLRGGLAPEGRYSSFTVHDPKQRRILAPCFSDRVVHHALMAHAGPVLERGLVDDSFACRVGKGTLAAVQRAQHHLRRHPWYVKADVRAYFASIDHGCLRALLSRRFKNADLLAIFDRVLDRTPLTPGRGLPIGALTSQHFANAYLDVLDRFLLERCKVRGMVRYMDDLVWWVGSRAEARDTLAALRAHAWSKRRLEVKTSAQVNRSAHGLSFLGFRVQPGTLRLLRRLRLRLRLRLRYAHEPWAGPSETGASRASTVPASRPGSRRPSPSQRMPMRRAGGGQSMLFDRTWTREPMMDDARQCGGGRTASDRVNRGGSWNNDARNCRAAFRNRNSPDNRWNNLGFRWARALGCAGWRPWDPAAVQSLGRPTCGKQHRGPGVPVGVAERRATARRGSALCGEEGR